MCLQTLLIIQVEKDFLSKSIFRKELKELATKLSNKDRFYIDNMIIYYCSLFRTKVDVEKDVLNYANQTQDTIAFLNNRVSSNNCNTSKKLITLINIKVEYVNGIKILKPTGS